MASKISYYWLLLLLLSIGQCLANDGMGARSIRERESILHLKKDEKINAPLLIWQNDDEVVLNKDIKTSKDESVKEDDANIKIDIKDFDRIKIKAEALEDQFESQGLKNLKISGSVDPVFLINKRTNTTSFSFLNSFNSGNSNQTNVFTYDNSFFGSALLDFQKENRQDVKFRLTLAPEKSAGSVTTASAIVHEASISIPLTDLQTRLIAGQLPDFSGYEYFFSHQQPLITHNLLFDFLAPAFYTGAGIEISDGKWLSKVLLANMNYSKYSIGNKTPALAMRIDYAKGEFKGFGFSTQHGKVNQQSFNLIETDGYYIHSNLTFQGQMSKGQQQKAAYNGGTARWTGLSALIGYRFSPRYQLTARSDFIENKSNGGGVLGSTKVDCYSAGGVLIQSGLDCRNGFGPGLTQNSNSNAWQIANAQQGTNRNALTMGLNYLLNATTTLKFEYRFDAANAAVFYDYKNGGYKNNNALLLTSIVATF